MTNYMKYYFQYNAASNWNDIPEYICCCKTVASFKNSYILHLLNMYSPYFCVAFICYVWNIVCSDVYSFILFFDLCFWYVNLKCACLSVCRNKEPGVCVCVCMGVCVRACVLCFYYMFQMATMKIRYVCVLFYQM